MSDRRPRIEYADPVWAMRACLETLSRRGSHYGGASYLLPDFVLHALAGAVLDCADGIEQVREWVPRLQWDDGHAQESLRRTLRFRLLDDITSKGHLPTALPTEEIQHALMRYRGENGFAEVPIESDDYDVVILTLWCPVRRPPIDREAAVKAGLL